TGVQTCALPILADDADAGKALRDLRRIVAGSVVDDDDLVRRAGLLSHRTQCPFQIGRTVIDRNASGYGRRRHYASIGAARSRCLTLTRRRNMGSPSSEARYGELAYATSRLITRNTRL